MNKVNRNTHQHREIIDKIIGDIKHLLSKLNTKRICFAHYLQVLKV
jgi:hypothetical protein